MAEWNLVLTLRGPYGGQDTYSMAISMPEDMGERVRYIRPPDPFPVIGSTFAETVELLRRKEFRKDLFKSECLRLGTLLAERMEDAEGWHDLDRVEPARKQLASAK